METPAQQPLTERLTNCFDTLSIVNGKPTNADAVQHAVADILIDYFIGNGADATNIWNYLEDSFANVPNIFPDQTEYVHFLIGLSAVLDKRTEEFRVSSAPEIFHDEEGDDCEESGFVPSEDALPWKIASSIETCVVFINNITDSIELSPITDLKNEIESIDSKLPIGKRHELAEGLKAKIAQLAATCNLYVSTDRVYDEKQYKQLTPDNISKAVESSKKIHFKTARGAYIPSVFGNAIALLKSIEAQKRLCDAMGNVDKSELKRLRLKFGAKGANLMAVKLMLPKLKGTDFEYESDAVKIPEFSLIAVDIYRKWKNGDDITEDLRVIFEKHAGKSLMVRSSAVYSEDGDLMTGAGIYISVPLYDKPTFEEFFDAVIKVYESCDSEKAKTYRDSNGVDHEEMGIVVQELVEGGNLRQINSTRPYSDDTAELFGEGFGTRIIFDTPKFDSMFFSGERNLDLLKYAVRVQSEILHMDHDMFSVPDIVAFARLLEKFYGQPVQIEISIDRDYEKHQTIFHFLQARPLPAKMFVIPHIEFPKDIEAIYECSAEGVCDEILDVLDVHDDNNDKKGLIVYRTSWQGSMHHSSLDRAMPKEGAAI